MSHVYRKQFTKPLPTDAELLQRKGIETARWRDATGKIRSAPVRTSPAGIKRLVFWSRTYTARFRDGAGVLCNVQTGCRDEVAARHVLAELERRAERVRSGILAPDENAAAACASLPVGDHIDAFDTHLRAKNVTGGHRTTTVGNIKRVLAECTVRHLRDLHRDRIERWLAEATTRSARSRNAHRNAVVSFVTWCVATKRLTSSPLAGLPKANERSDPRRQRRALTSEELARLIAVAQRRPVLDALTVRRGPRKGNPVAAVRAEVRERLETIGFERALIYKTLALTGLRKGELAALVVSDLRLDVKAPAIVLRATTEKNRRGSEIPLRADLAEDLREWLARRFATPTSSPTNGRVFTVPHALRKILFRDLRLAGIARVDDRGFVVDVHALRKTFGTLLSAGGVSLRVAQEAMRHADPRMTANVYTDPRLLDVRGAMDVLPSLPLGQPGD